MNSADQARFGYDDASWARDEVLAQLKEAGITRPHFEEGLILGSGFDQVPGKILEPERRVEGGIRRRPGIIAVDFSRIFRMLNEKGGDRQEIPLAQHKMAGHAQQLVVGRLREDSAPNRLMVVQSGREHPYEGVDTKRATFWLRVMQLLEVNFWVGSNAAGILTPHTLTPPGFMLVESDHDTCNGNDNPLVGRNDSRLGPKNNHMSSVYPLETLELIESLAKDLGIQIPRGLYARVKGPYYERPEDVYALRAIIGGIWEQARLQLGEKRFKDAVRAVVGMSTVYEGLVAQHASQSKRFPAFQEGRVIISGATNYSASLGPKGTVIPSNHKEVKDNMRKLAANFSRLMIALFSQRRQAKDEVAEVA